LLPDDKIKLMIENLKRFSIRTFGWVY